MLLSTLVITAMLSATGSVQSYKTLPSQLPDETILPKTRTRFIANPKTPPDPAIRERELEESTKFWNFRRGVVSDYYKNLGVGIQPSNRDDRNTKSAVELIKRNASPLHKPSIAADVWKHRKGQASVGAYRWRMRYIGVLPPQTLPRVDTTE